MTNESKRFYSIQRYENNADVYIFGDIVEERWWEEEVSPTSLIEEIKNLDVSEINVHINSYGGNVSAGWAIYSALRETKAKIKTYADGFVCSAANYPYLAGDERYASPVSAFYLHNVMSGAMGYAEDLRKAADEIEKLTEIGINAFVERAGMDRETVKALYDAETWLSPQEAKDYGIVTEILSESEQNLTQNARQAVYQRLFSKDLEESGTPAKEITESPAEPAEQPAEDSKPVKTMFDRLAGFYNAKN